MGKWENLMEYTDLILVFAIMGVLAGAASGALSLFSGSPISLIAYGVIFTLAGIVWGILLARLDI